MIIENNTAKLNDIVFANRNKSYGAYAIRSTYDNTIIKSLVITGLIFASLSALAMALSNTAPSEVKIDIGTNIPNEIYKVVEIINIAPPKTTAILPAEKPVVIPATDVVSTIIKDVITEDKKTVTQTIESVTNTENKTNTTTGNEPGGDPAISNPSGNGNNSEPGINNTSEAVKVPDIMPSFNIGPFLQQNLKYPEMALSSGISGKVVVNFIVDEEGNILKSTIIKSVGYGCDEEALRVIKLMPKWTPGRNNGKPVKVSFNQIIIFKLQ